jgi:pimeloyl-ACP methyl ester carboxylesterase
MTIASTSFVRARGCRLRVRRTGQGPALLLINGIGAPLEMWQPLVGELRGSEVITFDMPGCGLSPALGRPLGIRQIAEVVDDLLRVLGRRRVHVLGYSHGGLVAQELAYRRPDRVERLVLAATTPGLPAVPPNPLIAALMLTPARYYNRRAAETIVPLIAGGRSRRDPDVLRLNIDLRMTHPPSLRGYSHQLAATATWSSHRWLRRIPHETLVLHGDDDPLVPLHNGRYLARAIPRASLHVVPDAGHLLLLDEARLTGRLITSFLTRGLSGAAAAERRAA